MQTTSLPQFHHPEIQNLYHYGFDLPPAVIGAILQLPRATVIADLEAVLRDSIDRYDVYKDQEWNEKEHSFPFHAMLLLGGLRAEESLPLLLEVHQQAGDWIEFWFADWFGESMWEPLMWCGMNHFNDLIAFIKNNTAEDEFAPGNIFDAMVQVALHFPERHAEVVEKLKELFDLYLGKTHTDESHNEVEYNVTNLVNAVNDLKEDALVPLVEQCYKENLVDLEMFGNWDDFKSFYKDYEISKHNIFPNVADWYAHELKAQQEREALELKRLESKQQKSNPKGLSNLIPSLQTIFKPTKVGRNDPCPCGSGKKYKRCCGMDE